MMPGQRNQSEVMLHARRQQHKAVRLQNPLKNHLIASFKIDFPQAQLDRNFPRGGMADVKFIRAIYHRSKRRPLREASCLPRFSRPGKSGMSWNWTGIFWKVFSKRNLARQFPRLLRTPANQLLCDLADF